MKSSKDYNRDEVIKKGKELGINGLGDARNVEHLENIAKDFGLPIALRALKEIPSGTNGFAAFNPKALGGFLKQFYSECEKLEKSGKSIEGMIPKIAEVASQNQVFKEEKNISEKMKNIPSQDPGKLLLEISSRKELLSKLFPIILSNKDLLKIVKDEYGLELTREGIGYDPTTKTVDLAKFQSFLLENAAKVANIPSQGLAGLVEIFEPDVKGLVGDVFQDIPKE